MANHHSSLPRKIGLFSLIIPMGAVIASAFYPVRPIIQQALVGVVLIWLYITAILWYGA